MNAFSWLSAYNKQPVKVCCCDVTSWSSQDQGGGKISHLVQAPSERELDILFCYMHNIGYVCLSFKSLQFCSFEKCR